MTFVGVSRLAVPRSSSSPQRAQLLSTAFLLIVASTFSGVRRTSYYGKAFYIVVSEVSATQAPAIVPSRIPTWILERLRPRAIPGDCTTRPAKERCDELVPPPQYGPTAGTMD